MSEAEQILSAPVAEAAPAEGVKAPEAQPAQDPKLSQKLEVLMRREQQAMQRERLAKQVEVEIQDKLKLIEQFGQAKSDPKKALELLGMDYETLTKQMVGENAGPERELKALKEEIEQLKKMTATEKEQKALEEKRRAEAELQESTVTFKNSIKTFVDENKDKFELIQFDQAHDLVYDVIEAHYNRTIDEATGMGKILEIGEAAEKVEKYLEDKYKKVSEVKKLQSLLSQTTKPVHDDIVKQAKQANQSPQRPKTLTNALSASTTKPRTAPLTDQERIQKAIAYARQLRPSTPASV